MPIRALELLVLSDIHLGTPSCQARSLLRYLDSVRPKRLVLNGDILDLWHIRNSYWPDDHAAILARFFAWSTSGTEVTYLTGNHDGALRRWCGSMIGKVAIANELLLDLDGKRVLFEHGDGIEAAMGGRLLRSVGGVGYDVLLYIDRFADRATRLLGLRPASLSQRIKRHIPGAASYIAAFERAAARHAHANGCDAIVCGHVHQPVSRELVIDGRTIGYHNSGDWVEHGTALEYQDGAWTLMSVDDVLSGAMLRGEQAA
ncbi:MAG: UDP-2,3-diacylglucosamine diphosphatase [Planctomycetes bacterium]|nr:UDP-2,3-diacylglucosamine diphosphatase [Planctomycetota bacterium]